MTMHKARILVVDDEPGMLEVCRDVLGKLRAVEIVLEEDSTRAADMLSTDDWDLLIADIRMPELDGVELLRIARDHDPELPVLMLTAYPTVETAVESMKLGAADYLTKPFLPDDLLATAGRLIESRRVHEENRLLRRQLERAYASGEMIGNSPAMRGVFDMTERIAPTDVDVLIIGETGTGKELVARSIHQRSPRRGARFVPVDCGAIPEDLLESEFFGHERGAFTGAHTRSLGLLEFANGGTFFLDEIGQLPMKLQAKLLRALQERTIRRLGGKEEIEVDVRIVAATSLDLQEEARKQRFRMDLYYRINVARIELPPLRQRVGDIPILTAHFVERYARDMGLDQVEIDPQVIEVLGAYPWPGNVRELQNVIKRALTTGGHDTIMVDDLPDEIVTAAGDRSGRGVRGFFAARERHVAAFERHYLTELLRTHRGDVTRAAADAEVPRGTLYRLLKSHAIDPAEFRE
ncbi:MAG: sigma-54-dependent Fis family transcriptional regulator [Gemmatimonadetes bacterium]|nr:sigma-54-dependent Fis family transcriptional regulator [Gemmatimonadota bacterium]